MRRADAVVAVSRYLADYIHEHAGIRAVHLPIQLLDADEWPELGHPENPFITFVNPCVLKGLPIFLGLADAFPGETFAAVPTWGTTAADLEALRARPNVQILPPADDIRDILRRTKVTLVPSLWAEARARIVVESMLSGVPVLASDVAGTREASLGVPCALPVNPTIEYEDRFDDRMIRVAKAPPQDLTPWREALARLLTDRDHYRHMARLSRDAAQRYAATIDLTPLESLLTSLATTPRTGSAA
jgi:glycosyltransferase involved in cell wall biosynthesis